MKPSVIRETLSGLDMTPSKPLGQNFLHDTQLAAWIVRQLELEPGDHLVEIGPGLGALTEHALPLATSATLIEKDGRLARHLESKFGGFSGVRVHHMDAVAFDTRPLLSLAPVKVLGNLPYYVSSQIIFRFTAEPSPATRMVFMLQKEMARRLTAAPGTADYGLPTVLLSLDWRLSYLRSVPPQVFVPEPRVDSALVRLDALPLSERPVCDRALFHRVVHVGFAQRRKQLRKLLAAAPGLLPSSFSWEAFAAAQGLSETARAEELAPAHWLALTHALDATSGDPAQRLDEEFFDIVDEADVVIGRATRRQTHAENLRHRAVQVTLTNDAGEVLLQRRSQAKDKCPGCWDNAATGHVESGQTYEETARRELSEELGVDAPMERRLVSLPCSEATGWEFVEVYLARLPSGHGPLRPAPAEVQTTVFLLPALVSQWMERRPEDFTPVFRQIWPLIRGELAMGNG